MTVSRSIMTKCRSINYRKCSTCQIFKRWWRIRLFGYFLHRNVHEKYAWWNWYTLTQGIVSNVVATAYILPQSVHQLCLVSEGNYLWCTRSECVAKFCQNLVVHPKCTLGGSTKCHVFHALPTHPPQKWEFWILAFLDLASKVFHKPPPPPMGIWDFSGPFSNFLVWDIGFYTFVCCRGGHRNSPIAKRIALWINQVWGTMLSQSLMGV